MNACAGFITGFAKSIIFSFYLNLLSWSVLFKIRNWWHFITTISKGEKVTDGESIPTQGEEGHDESVSDAGDKSAPSGGEEVTVTESTPP